MRMVIEQLVNLGFWEAMVPLAITAVITGASTALGNYILMKKLITRVERKKP